MPVETELSTETMPKQQVWAAYNHMPGGQILAIHFENNIRQKKIGDTMQSLLFTAKEQVEAFARGEQVMLNINGQITKNKVLVFQGPDLSYNPKAADVVIEWAKTQGMRPIQTQNDKEPKGYEKDKRLEAVEGDVKELKDSVSSIAKSLEKLAEAIGKK